jgi:hypothetical protein
MGQTPAFTQQQVGRRAGDAQAVRASGESLEVGLPEAGAAFPYGDGLEQTVTVLQTTVGYRQ